MTAWAALVEAEVALRRLLESHGAELPTAEAAELRDAHTHLDRLRSVGWFAGRPS